MKQVIETHPLAGRFNRLTPEEILDAVEAGGRRCSGRFIILNSYENRVLKQGRRSISCKHGRIRRRLTANKVRP